MKRVEQAGSEPRFRLAVCLFRRKDDTLAHQQIIEGNNQLKLLVKIWHIVGALAKPGEHYLVIKTDGSRERPEWLIRNLKARRIAVIEPEKYPDGKVGCQLS
jgi:hypothetical protein